MLDVLVFTDATSDQSLSGAPGFQFVARSEGADPSDERFVQQHLQHTVPSTLGSDAWADHPPTCAYARDGERLYLSRGRSTGATLGGRPGNQRTVTAMTSDPHDVLPLRPAQLASSPAWDRSLTGKRIDAWTTPLEIDEDFDVLGLRALVDDPRSARLLPLALTMLEQTQATPRVRLGIRHPEQRHVLRWVALLSRFLDQDSALGLEFRVFTEDPARANVHVIGIHPSLAPELTVAGGVAMGINVLDLESLEATDVAPSESAARSARWFLEGDPYEALDAIEVGRRWARSMDLALATRAAELVAIGVAPGARDETTVSTVLAAIDALAAAGEADELEAYGEELGDLVATSATATLDQVHALDVATGRLVGVREHALATALALTALEWSAANPRLLEAWAQGGASHEALVWDDDDARAHAAALLAQAAEGTDPAHAAAVLALAARLDTGVAVSALERTIASVVDRVLETPGLAASRGQWLHADTIATRVATAVDAALANADESATRALLDGSWDWLADAGPGAAGRLARWLAIRGLGAADAQRRAEILARAGADLPGSAWRLVLPTSQGLDPEEVTGWTDAQGDLDPALAAEIERTLAAIDQHPRWGHLGAARVLDRVDRLASNPSPTLRVAAERQRAVLALFDEAYRYRAETPNPSLRTLADLHREVVAQRYADWIAKAVLECEDVRGATMLAAGRHEATVIERTMASLARGLRKRPDRMLAAVRLLAPSRVAWASATKAVLDEIWDDRATEPLRADLLASVDGRLDASGEALLEGFLERQAKGRIARGVLRGTRAMLGKRDE